MGGEAVMLRMFEKERDYPLASTWWQGHGWPPVSEHILPRLGLVGEIDGKPVAAAWLYMDNSVGVAMLEWMVADPGAAPRAVLAAMRRVTEGLKAEASRLDYGVILTSCRQPGLVKFWQKQGFVKTDDDVTHLLFVRPE